MRLYVHVFSFIFRIADSYEKDDIQWLLVVPEYTELTLNNLLKLINQHQSSKPKFIGRALKDDRMVIVHHFAQPGILYPDTSAGILLNWAAVKLFSKLSTTLNAFNIDSRHEVSIMLLLS